MRPIDYLVVIKQLELNRGSHTILSGVDLLMAEGEFCYLCGPTGSGKSTFLKALYGAVPIAGGSVRILDQEVTTLHPDQMPHYRRKLGIVFQEILLVDEWTVSENLDLVLRATDWKDGEERAARIDEVLDQVGLHSARKTRIKEMSGGEKCLVALARSVLNKPRLLLADEPTGSLDSKASAQVMKVLIQLARLYKSSVILGTHDVHLLERYPARTYLCREGSLVEQTIGIDFNR